MHDGSADSENLADRKAKGAHGLAIRRISRRASIVRNHSKSHFCRVSGNAICLPLGLGDILRRISSSSY